MLFKRTTNSSCSRVGTLTLVPIRFKFWILARYLCSYFSVRMIKFGRGFDFTLNSIMILPLTFKIVNIQNMRETFLQKRFRSTSRTIRTIVFLNVGDVCLWDSDKNIVRRIKLYFYYTLFAVMFFYFMNNSHIKFHFRCQKVEFYKVLVSSSVLQNITNLLHVSWRREAAISIPVASVVT